MKYYFTIIFLIIIWSCSDSKTESKNILADNINLYSNSKAWELAKAVENQDTVLIKQICIKQPPLLKYQEPRFGQTLLEWAVYTDRYEASKTLAELGADPNRQSFNGTSAFIHAADNNNTADYVKLLLKHGGDPNAIAKPKPGAVENVQQLKTPLIAAAGSNLESVKRLVEAGADINYSNEQYQSALYEAYTFNRIDVIRYLIIEKGTDFKRPLMQTIKGESLYLTDLLRNMTFKLESDSYKVKMEVVEYLKERGMNYWETPIPKRYYDLYPKEYLEKY
jgi:ankyrin repeat protein